MSSGWPAMITDSSLRSLVSMLASSRISSSRSSGRLCASSMISTVVSPASARLLQQLFELEQQRRLRFAGAVAQLEPRRQHLDELVARQRRVLQVHAVHARRLPLERRADERRLAGAGFADQQRDALAAGDPVLEVAQRLPVDVGQHQEPRVRRQVERPLAKAVEGLVHTACRSEPAVDQPVLPHDHDRRRQQHAGDRRRCGQQQLAPPRLPAARRRWS